jgi:hypothetical protein
MSAPFQPGDCVECIDAKPDALDPKANLLKEAAIYRVARVGIREDGEAAVAFHAIPIPGTQGKRGYAFCVRRFRKIDDEQYPEVLAMLRNLPVKQGENA